MKWSFSIGRVLGIRIRIHVLFVLLVGILVLPPLLGGRTQAATATLAAVLLLFGFVLLHELGHSVVAMRLGVRVLDITLWPLGGLARLGRIPERPSAELAIALAGPAVNLVLALGILVLASALGVHPFRDAVSMRPTTLLGFSLLANLMMASFNLIPAFPMDGGRVLRALLATRMSFLRATRAAVRVGVVFGIAFVAVGILIGHVVLAAIGLFVLASGPQEERMARLRQMVEQGGAGGAGGLVVDEEGRPIRDPRPRLPIDLLRDALESGNMEGLRDFIERSRRPPPPWEDGPR